MKIISRKDAKAEGLTSYFTGEPCKRGHISRRLVCDYHCVECHNEKCRRQNKTEKRRTWMRKRMRDYRKENPVIMRAIEQRRQEKHGPLRAEQRRLERAANPERHKAILRKSFQKHKAKRLAESKAWRLANKEAHAEHMRVAKAKRRATEGKFRRQDIKTLMKKQRGLCVGCQTDISLKYHIDHIQPIVRGGSNWPNNLQLMCGPCNQSKGAKTMEEWIAYRAEITYQTWAPA
jgi:HNH endonuclease